MQKGNNTPMPTPTLVVSGRDFETLGAVSQYVIHGRRGLRIVPKVAQEIGENEVIFPNGPREIIFRKRFSRKTVKREVRFITADNSERYDLKFIVNLR